jgi:KTSC domain
MNPRPSLLFFPFIALCFVAAAVADPAWTDRKASITTSRIPRQPVRSSALASIGYSKRLHILEIEFRKGAIYRYLDVPQTVYRRLMSAGSKTRYYDRNIRGHYRSLHVRPRAKEQQVH